MRSSSASSMVPITGFIDPFFRMRTSVPVFSSFTFFQESSAALIAPIPSKTIRRARIETIYALLDGSSRPGCAAWELLQVSAGTIRVNIFSKEDMIDPAGGQAVSKAEAAAAAWDAVFREF